MVDSLLAEEGRELTMRRFYTAFQLGSEDQISRQMSLHGARRYVFALNEFWHYK